MQATVSIIHDPFHPMRGREVRAVLYPVTLGDLAPATAKPFICLRNGEAVLRKDWQQQVSDADVIAFVTLPQGGGGGSNPMRLLLMIAVIAMAPYAVGMVSTLAGGVLSATAAGLVSAGFIAAGSMLVNALIPPPKPPSFASANALAAPSPTYNLQSQGNYARLDSAIPVQYGRIKLYPDFGAQPYAEYSGNEQYLYQLLVLGQGEFDVESINIEDTPIENFDEITTEIIPPGGTLTLFPANVSSSIEVSGQELAGIESATYARSTTTVTVTETAHGRAAGQWIYFDATSGAAADGAYQIATVPTADTYTFTHADSGTVTAGATCNIHSYIGPFVANAATTAANALGIDIILSRGLYMFNSGTGATESDSVSFVVEAQEVDDSGTPVGSWVELAATEITAATTTPQRYSYRYATAAARYQVRMRRTDAKQTASNYGNDVLWGGLRAYLPDSTDFGNVTLLAMIMRASNNLSMQASRKINVVATRKLLTWDPVGEWSASTTATRSIAWALADALTNDIYGGRLDDSRVDLQALYDRDAIWSARGDTFDGRFDNSATLWEGITQIAQAGRAKPYIQGGIVRFARDEAAEFPVALFSMRNIVRGSFGIEYILPSETTADAVEATYVDNSTWTPQTVTAYLTGSSAALPAKVTLFGVTERDQAYREAMYQSAANRYRRKLIKFSTEMEGFIPAFGDLIAIQHDMPAWGQFAEVIRQDSVENLARYSEDLTGALWGIGSSTIDDDATVAPDGTTSADMVTGVTQDRPQLPINDCTIGASYIASIYAKAGTSTWLRFRFNQLATWFDLSAVAVGTSNNVGAGIDDMGDGWYRCWVQDVATSINETIEASPVGVNNSSTATGTVYLWGAQVNAGTSIQPYVKTTSATVSAEVLTLSEQLTWDTTGTLTHYIGLRAKDGSVNGPYACTWSDIDKVAISSLDVTPYTGSAYERTHVSFGWGETWRQEARVIAIRPRGLYQVEIEAVNEDPSVHTAEDGITAPAVNSSQLPTLYTAPVVRGLVVVSLPSDPSIMLMSWQQASGADYYIIEQSQDSSDWTRVAETRAANYSGKALYGSATIVRVAAVGLTRGPWVTVSYGDSADYMWTTDGAAMWDIDDTELMWRY